MSKLISPKTVWFGKWTPSDRKKEPVPISCLVKSFSTQTQRLGPSFGRNSEAVLQRCGQQGQVPRAICVNRVLATGASTGRLRPGDVWKPRKRFGFGRKKDVAGLHVAHWWLWIGGLGFEFRLLVEGRWETTH